MRTLVRAHPGQALHGAIFQSGFDHLGECSHEILSGENHARHDDPFHAVECLSVGIANDADMAASVLGRQHSSRKDVGNDGRLDNLQFFSFWHDDALPDKKGAAALEVPLLFGSISPVVACGQATSSVPNTPSNEGWRP